MRENEEAVEQVAKGQLKEWFGLVSEISAHAVEQIWKLMVGGQQVRPVGKRRATRCAVCEWDWAPGASFDICVVCDEMVHQDCALLHYEMHAEKDMLRALGKIK